MKKIIIFTLFIILGIYFIYNRNNSNIIVNNVEKNKEINLKNKFDISNKNIDIIDKNIDVNNTNISNFIVTNKSNSFEKVTNTVEYDYLHKDTEVITNTDLYYLDGEDFEMEINLDLSNFVYEFSEKENLNLDDLEDVLKY